MEAAPAPVLVISSQTLSTYRRIQWVFIVLGVVVYLLFAAWSAFFSTVDIDNSFANESSEIDSVRPLRCLLRTCVSKCCPDGEGFDSVEDRSCSVDNTSDPEDFMEVLTSKFPTRGDAEDRVVEMDDTEVFAFIDSCEDGTMREYKYNESFMVGGGSLLINNELYVDQSSSCFEFVIDDGALVVDGCGSDLNAHGGYPTAFAEMVEHLTLLCMCVSTACLVVVLFVYACIPQLRNLQGKVLMCFVSSVIVFHFNFITSSFVPATYTVFGLAVTPYLSQGSRLCLLFWMSWLTVMCYDIWSTFSRPLKPRVGSDLHATKFLCYSVAGWGCPILVTLAYLGVFADGPYDYKARTGFISLEVYLNLVMFLSTLANMRLHKIARTDSLHSEGSQRHGSSSKDGIWLYGKLSFLMGFDWFLFLLARAVGSSELSSVAFVVIESQGMFLFVLLLSNKRVFRLLCERFRTKL